MKSAAATETDKVVDNLNELLRGELSAVETYDQAIRHINDQPLMDLSTNRDCHMRRVQALKLKIGELHGEPDKSSGMWGSFAKLVEQSASLINSKTIIAALEEGEDRGLATYRKPGNIDPVTSSIIQTLLLPKQLETHARMSRCKRALENA